MFELGKDELKELNRWEADHNKTCIYANPMNQGAIGGRFTYSFTPTGLGVISKIDCACGESVDLTNYNEW